MNKIIIEAIVRKALKDMKDSPERSIRNLVDMGLNFAVGETQKSFFQAVQEMLQNENSAYYRLIQDIANNVDSERLLRFGMNIGYNSCTKGSSGIRRIESEENFNIPWALFLELNGRKLDLLKDAYLSTFKQGEILSIFTYILMSDCYTNEVISLIAEHSDDAFVLCCPPKEITESVLDEAMTINNIMFAVSYEEGVEKACRMLRDRNMLYSVYVTYSEKDFDNIAGGELFAETEVLHPVLTIMHADKGCPVAVRKKIYDELIRIRKQSKYSTIPWESFFDNCVIDGIISNDECIAGFDADGYLYTYNGKNICKELNLFSNSLKEILRSSFPKVIEG